MKQTGKCLKCNSTDLIADGVVPVAQHASPNTEMTVATFKRPEAIIFKGERETNVSAWVCCQCGYLELYADKPKNLRQPPT